MQTERELGDDGERPERPAQQPRQVVARDVLHDPAAGLRARAVGEHEARADHEVAGRAVAVAQRPGGVGRDDAAERGVAAVRRIEHQPLAVSPLGAQGGVEIGQPHARLRDADEVAGLERDHAVELAQREELALRGAAPAELGAAAARDQRLAGGIGLPHELGDLLLRGRSQHQNRSPRPAASTGCTRWNPGTSPHSRGVGSSLPGLEGAPGSNARAQPVHHRQIGAGEHLRHRARLVVRRRRARR